MTDRAPPASPQAGPVSVALAWIGWPLWALMRPLGVQSFLRDLWRLSRPYFAGEDRWIGRSLLAVVVALNVGVVWLNVLFNDWYGRFYNSLEQKDEGAFFTEMKMFGVLAAIFIAVGVSRSLLNSYLQLRWRRWSTGRYLDSWLGRRAYYRIELLRGADNPDQRIADDVRLFISYTLSLSLGLLSAVLTLVSFVAILWGLSGPLTFALGGTDVTVPGYMVWVALVYALAGTWLAHLVGRPLIDLNFRRQKLEADFRFDLIRVRENAEPVALYRGEKIEREALGGRFGLVLANNWRIIVAEMRLGVYQIGYDQIAVVFPFLVASPRFFSGAITLGVLMQISQSFGQVQNALSFFISRYGDLAEWRAVMDRLLGFEAAIRAAETAPDGPEIVADPDAREVSIEDATLALPDGRALVEIPRLAFRPGERTLVMGASGSGKSTLFRTLSGIWPFGRGRVVVPADQRVLFLPQRAYLPIGTLRDAVRYPDETGRSDDAAVREALDAVGLGPFADRLDESAHWGNRLSGGEQQRLAVARALLYRPDWLFLDEATASVDEAMEERLYRLLRERLPKAAIVSIGHRPSLRRWHERILEVTRDPAGGTGALVEKPV